MTQASAQYALAGHVRVCRAGDHLVLLDLQRDRYLGLSRADAAQVVPNIIGLTATYDSDAQTHPRNLPDAARNETLDELLRGGLLTLAGQGAPMPAAINTARPERALVEGYAEDRVEVSARHIARIASSILRARLLLRGGSLTRLVQRAQRMRAAAPARFDEQLARKQMLIFQRLRPLFYADFNACLLHSVIIKEFLAKEGVFPRLIFGVATQPFKAHCWLQADEIVINDLPGYVRGFTPILAE